MTSDGIVDEMLHDNHSESVALLVALVERVPDDDALASLGAGPLEDLMSHYRNGLRWLDDVEAAARRDPRFAAAVSGMWLGADVPISGQYGNGWGGWQHKPPRRNACERHSCTPVVQREPGRPAGRDACCSRAATLRHS